MHRYIHLVIAALGLLLVGCGIEGSPYPAASPGATSTTTATSETPPATTSTPPPAPEVRFSCYLDEGRANPMSFRIPVGGAFTAIWVAKPELCDVARDVGTLTPFEETALTTAGFTDTASVNKLYELCTRVSPDDISLSPGLPSTTRIEEINGMLALCPGHPLAAQLKGAIAQALAPTTAEVAGESFHGGTFLVGTEVQPGTYAVEGEIENCYWERTNARGEIIDNGFVVGARRVEVTIHSSDYSFHNQGCGEWLRV